MGLFGSGRPGVAAARLAEFGDLSSQPPDQSGQQGSHCRKAAARLNQRGIEIGRTINLELHGMDARCRISVAFQNVTAGIGPVMCSAATHFRKIAKTAADQRSAARCAKAVTQHEIRRGLSAARQSPLALHDHKMRSDTVLAASCLRKRPTKKLSDR